MSKNIDEILGNIKTYISEHSSPDKWLLLTIKDISTTWSIPSYLSGRVMLRLRMDPTVRYRFAEGRTRFKPREFLISTPEEKIKDLESIRQFEMRDVEAKYLYEHLKDFRNTENLEMFYLLMIICEKMKIQEADKDWTILDLNEYTRAVGISSYELYKHLDILNKTGLLRKSPTTRAYRLIVSDEILKEAEKVVDKQLLNKSEEIKVDENISIYADPDKIESSKELRNLEFYSKSIMTHNSKIGELMVSIIKVHDALLSREQAISKQREAFNLLNDTYNETVLKLEELQKKYDELDIKYKALNKAFDLRANQAKEELGLLQSELMTRVEQYFALPLHKKNEVITGSQFKNDLQTSIITRVGKAIDNVNRKSDED